MVLTPLLKPIYWIKWSTGLIQSKSFYSPWMISIKMVNGSMLSYGNIKLDTFHRWHTTSNAWAKSSQWGHAIWLAGCPMGPEIWWQGSAGSQISVLEAMTVDMGSTADQMTWTHMLDHVGAQALSAARTITQRWASMEGEAMGRSGTWGDFTARSYMWGYSVGEAGTQSLASTPDSICGLPPCWIRPADRCCL